MLLRRARGFGQIDLARGQPGAQFLGRQVHQLEVRAVQHGIGQRLPDGDAGNLAHRLGAAFDVLDVQGREDINAGVQQFEHVLVTFGVAGAGRIGVGELIHQRELRTARQHRVQVHLRERDAAIVAAEARDDRQALGQRIGFLAPVGLDVTDDDVPTGGQLTSRGFEHRVGLADARGHAEEDLQLAPLLASILLLDSRQERVWVRPGLVTHGSIIPVPRKGKGDYIGLGKADARASVRLVESGARPIPSSGLLGWDSPLRFTIPADGARSVCFWRKDLVLRAMGSFRVVDAYP